MIALVVALWLALAFVAAVAVRRASFLFPERITSSFDDASRFGEDRGVAARVKEIEALGFEPLGVRVERVGLARTRDVSLASRAHPCFASVHRDWNLVLFYFVTAFDDGTVVLTTSRPIRRRSDRYLAAAQPADALRLHLERVRASTAKPLMQPDRATRLATSRAFYAQPEVRRHVRFTGFLALFNLATVALACGLLLRLASGFSAR